jgi:hypothetical protein
VERFRNIDTSRQTLKKRRSDHMRSQLEQRIKELKLEFGSGQKMLVDLEMRQANIRNTLLRISGAIQVLEEELGMAGEPGGNGAQPVLGVATAPEMS